MDEKTLAGAFQVSERNPLSGVSGRAGLLNVLGRTLREKPEIFGQTLPRIGNLYDYFLERADGGTIAARNVLVTVLNAFSPIWPGRIELGGENLGDVWRHPAIRRDDASDGLVPFHKLPQWLTYSLVEPLEAAGICIVRLSELTGLAEYRNGGLFVDTGVIAPKHEGVLRDEHDPGSEVVVEWRALTVALLDRIVEPVRSELGMRAESLPLARILEGGTWRAGREIAAELRADASPPIRVRSTGTLF